MKFSEFWLVNEQSKSINQDLLKTKGIKILTVAEDLGFIDIEAADDESKTIKTISGNHIEKEYDFVHLLVSTMGADGNEIVSLYTFSDLVNMVLGLQYYILNPQFKGLKEMLEKGVREEIITYNLFWNRNINCLFVIVSNCTVATFTLNEITAIDGEELAVQRSKDNLKKMRLELNYELVCGCLEKEIKQFFNDFVYDRIYNALF